MKTLRPRILKVLFFIAIFVVFEKYAIADDTLFRAHLNGKNQFPPNVSTGFAEMKATLEGQQLKFKMYISNTEQITSIHIHFGNSKSIGPVVFVLDHPNFDGLVEGVIVETDLIRNPEVGITSWAEFLTALKKKFLYIDVHSLDYPEGAIRGQLLMK